MLWFNNRPIKQRRRLFPSALPQGRLSVHFLLAVQKKVNKSFYFLSGRSERKCEGLSTAPEPEQLHCKLCIAWAEVLFFGSYLFFWDACQKKR